MTEEDQGGLGPLGLMELHGGSEIQVADAVPADDQGSPLPPGRGAQARTLPAVPSGASSMK